MLYCTTTVRLRNHDTMTRILFPYCVDNDSGSSEGEAYANDFSEVKLIVTIDLSVSPNLVVKISVHIVIKVGKTKPYKVSLINNK